MASVRDFRAELLVPEDTELSRMAEIRQFGFSSGRHCAHLAQRLLGLEPSPVLRKDRVPMWPGHSVGSITHSRKIAAAMASTGHTGVGIDIEQSDRVDEKLHRVLFTNTEQETLGDCEFDDIAIQGNVLVWFRKQMLELQRQGGFPGAQRIQDELKNGPDRLLVGIRPEGRAPAREGVEIQDLAGNAIGKITSGGFGPTVGGPIAMGYVNHAFANSGTKVRLVIRGKALPALVANMPFAPHRYFRKK